MGACHRKCQRELAFCVADKEIMKHVEIVYECIQLGVKKHILIAESIFVW